MATHHLIPLGMEAVLLLVDAIDRNLICFIRNSAQVQCGQLVMEITKNTPFRVQDHTVKESGL